MYNQSVYLNLANKLYYSCNPGKILYYNMLPTRDEFPFINLIIIDIDTVEPITSQSSKEPKLRCKPFLKPNQVGLVSLFYPKKILFKKKNFML